MNDKVEGIILSIGDYKENDVILQVLTAHLGIISLVAKGSRKISSKSHFLPMNVYEFIFDYKENKTIFTLHNSKLLKFYYEEKDLKLLAFKNVLLQVSLKSNEFANEEMYDNLLFIFERINKDNMYLLGAMYFSYLCKIFGISPYVDGCVICDKKQVVAISKNKGGFLCDSHLSGEEILDVIRLKKFRLLVKADFKHYEILKDKEYDKNDFDLIVNFFISNSDLNLSSLKFYESI